MLKIHGNKLSTEGIHFALPENFYIDIEGMETVTSNGIRFLSVPEDCYINFMTSVRRCNSSKESINQNFCESNINNVNCCRIIDGPCDYEHNGLTGTWVKYEVNSTYYCEIHLNKIAGYDEQAEVLIAVNKSETNLDRTLDRPEVKGFLNSFMLSK